ncbi:MAG: T9SS type A sorting domain-containing protein [Bacteroidota bacterium]
MKKVLLVIALSLSLVSLGQNYLHQVLVLNEGYYDYQTGIQGVPVTVGSFNPSTQTYQEVTTINGMRFSSDLLIDGSVYYVAADSKILKYDLNTHAQLAEVNCPGVRNLGVYQGKLVATRGEYLTTYDSYLHVYDANTLSLIAAVDTVTGPKWAAQNVMIDGAKAYIAVNNGYEWGNEKGIIGVLDLNTLTYGNEVDLGPDGKNPDNLVKYGNFLYTVNNKDWSGSSISKVALDGSVNTTTNLAAATGCGTSSLRDNQIVYQISMQSDLNAFDINIMNNLGPVVGHQTNYYELAQEPVSGNFYCTETDYLTYGKVNVFDANNQEINEFNAGVAPGTVVFDVRSSANLNELSEELEVFPNPCQEYLTVNLNGEKRLMDAQGKTRLLTSNNSLDLSALPAGFYVLQCQGKISKIIKE